MGFTPLEGLVMGTRSGDVDPAVLDYVAQKEGLSPHDVEMLLNKQSGLLGISGLTHDMRELLAEADEHDDRRARLAIDLYAYRARKYVGSYLAALGGADAIVLRRRRGRERRRASARRSARGSSSWACAWTRPRTTRPSAGARAASAPTARGRRCG